MIIISNSCWHLGGLTKTWIPLQCLRNNLEQAALPCVTQFTN